ncbi:MAG: hopanoid biosynthesis-associated protein HpnK [Gammaproteobacteria bacterium]
MIGNKHRPNNRRRLIVTADDFGLDKAVNEAVEQAWREGILTAAGLMVGAPATADAVEKARRLDGLGIGLHLVLTDGEPVLPVEEVNLLTDSQGRFNDNMVAAGVRFFFDYRARRQLAAEIRAQFEAFRRTGLRLDHLSVHKHFHLHPTVLSLVMAIGREYGLKAVRLPREAPEPRALVPWLALMRLRLLRAGLRCNDQVFGLAHTGQMDEVRMVASISKIPYGITEIYCHPASRNDITPAMDGYLHTRELAALLSPRVAAAIDQADVEMIAFRDIA